MDSNPISSRLPEELTPDQINQSIDLSPQVEEILKAISELKYLSEVSAYRKELPHIVFRLKLSEEEVDVIVNKLNIRKAELLASEIGGVATDDGLHASDEWSPSGMLKTDEKPREPDWRERQLPPSDR